MQSTSILRNKTDQADAKALLEDAENGVPQFLRHALAEAGREVGELEQRILDIERQLREVSRQNPLVMRMLLIHGARSILNAAKRVENPDRLRVWLLSLETRAGHNRAAVALANKMACIA